MNNEPAYASRPLLEPGTIEDAIAVWEEFEANQFVNAKLSPAAHAALASVLAQANPVLFVEISEFVPPGMGIFYRRNGKMQLIKLEGLPE